jgi:hypothetical protein
MESAQTVEAMRTMVRNSESLPKVQNEGQARELAKKISRKF